MSDISILARIYKKNIQRVGLELKELNSNAAFIFVDVDRKRVILWVGSLCSNEDKKKAENFAFLIIREDFSDSTGTIKSMEEKREKSDILPLILNLLSVKLEDYRMHKSMRLNSLENYQSNLYMIKKTESNQEFYLEHISIARIDIDGKYLEHSFLPPLDNSSIILITTNNVCDLWFADQISPSDFYLVEALVANMFTKNTKSTTNTTDINHEPHFEMKIWTQIFNPKKKNEQTF